jgi:hypothetical protein
LVPPDEILAQRAAQAQREYLSGLVAEMFEETSIEEDMIAEFAAVPPDGLRQDVTSLHKRDRTARWSQAAADRVADDYADERDDVIRERFAEMMAESFSMPAEG